MNIPNWINRLASFARICNCLLPKNLNNNQFKEKNRKDSIRYNKLKIKSKKEFEGYSILIGE